MIQTNLNQKEKPQNLIVDSRGNIIREGMNIAYNKSGNVVLGEISKIKRNEWEILRPGSGGGFWWGLKFEMEVRNEDDSISILKNPNSFVII